MCIARCVDEFLAYRAAETESVPYKALGFNKVVSIDDVITGGTEIEEWHFACFLRAIDAHGKILL